MSLHKFAEQVASQGRGDDSLLVHMTPDEVRNLQQFAQANGTTLTINPTTGLPEAGLLSDLFKAVAPIALGAFLGPAGVALGGPGLSATMAGLATGGITSLATGSLSRGLMAGLGAYGGAGLGDSLMKAGTGALSQSVGTGLSEEAAQQAVASKLASATPMETLTAGFNSATASPAAMGAFAKNNLSNIGMAAAPILAMQPTTQMPSTAKSDNYIRQFDYNINPDTGRPDPLYGMRAMTPVKASEFGNKTFQGQRDLFRQQNPNPYDIGIGSLNQPPQQQPTPMAGGGIVALAEGGDVIRMAGGTPPAMLSDEQLYQKTGSWEAAAAARDDQNRAMNIYNDAQRLATATYVPPAGGLSNVKVNTQAEVDAANAANPFSAQNMAKVDTTRQGHYVQDPTTGQQVALTSYSPGFDINNTFALQNLGQAVAQDKAGTKSGVADYFNQNATAAQKAKADQLWATELARLQEIDRAAGRLPTLDAGTNKGLTDLNNSLTNQDQNKNLNAGLTALDDGRSRTYKWFEDRKLGFKPIDISIENWFNEYTDDLALLRADKQVDAMKDALNVSGMNEADLVEATGKTIAQWIQQKKEERKDGTKIIAGDLKDVPADSLPGGVSGGGNTFVNANGTITTKPDFSLGMGDVRDMYTKGGGSLGYTSPVVKTPAEHEAAYNKLTDDSLDAYNFLMGKGKNLSQRTASADRPVMRRYDEGVLGRKIPKLTKPSTTTTKTDTKETVAGNTAVVGGVSFDLTNPAQAPAEDNNGPWSWDMALKRWVQYGKMADGGMTGYAMGGGLGSLGSYSDGGRLLKGPGDGVSDSIPATIGRKQQPARLADGEFVVPARIVSELGNGSTDAGAKKLYAMLDRVQRARGKTTGKNKVAANSRADKYLPA